MELRHVRYFRIRFRSPPLVLASRLPKCVVIGDEIRARGATDLRTALALLGGVSVAPGGDAGPASAVPGLLGVREVDDLLLLIVLDYRQSLRQPPLHRPLCAEPLRGDAWYEPPGRPAVEHHARDARRGSHQQ
jgi:hypothetical protein